MRIETLELRAFGPFTGHVLQFPDECESDLQIVYGANEAGKSSALRALRQFLFGIPHNSTDNFVHDHKKLRIAARLRSQSGDVLDCVRRKGNKDTLRVGDDSAAVDSALLATLLGGVGEDQFGRMYGIDHAALVRGGREIVEFRGDLGAILFAASEGIANLSEVQKALEKEAGELFARKAQNPKINAAVAAFEQARKQVKEAQLSGPQWNELRQRITEQEGRLKELQDCVDAARAERSRLERVQAALPFIARRAGLLEQFAPLATERLPPAEVFHDRVELLGAWNNACESERRSSEQVEKLTKQLEESAVRDNVLAEEASIAPLADEIGSARKAQRDLPGLVVRHARCLEDGREILTELRPDLMLDQAAAHRLTRKQQAELQNLGNAEGRLVERLEGLRQASARNARELRAVEERLRALPPPQDADPLKSLLSRLVAHGDVEGALAQSQQALQAGEEALRLAVAQLPRWSGSSEELQQRPLPSAETVEAFEENVQRGRQALDKLRDRCEDAEKVRADADREVAELQLAGRVPTEEQLAAARQQRDDRWPTIRSREATDEVYAVYEAAVREADDLADRLRREATRVASLAHLQSRLRTTQDELARLAKRQSQATAEVAQLEADWRAAWQPAGIEPGTPREMRAWLLQKNELTRLASEIRQLRLESSSLAERLANARADLNRELARSAEPAAAEGESWSALVARAQAVVERNEEVAGNRRHWTEEATELRRKCADATSEIEAAEAEIRGWATRWAQAVTPLGLPADASVQQATDIMARWQEMFAGLKEAAGVQKRIEDINQDRHQFEAQVADLAARLEPSLAKLPVEDAASRLLEVLRQSKTDKEKRELLEKQLFQRRKECEEAQAARRDAESRLNAMRQEAGCKEYDELAEIEGRSRESEELFRRLADIDERLVALSGGLPLEAFVEAVTAEDADGLPGRIASCAERIEEGSGALGALHQAIGRDRETLRAMDGGAKAAEAEELAQSLLAGLPTVVERYVQTHLAGVLLRRAIERFREKNQAPLLERASQLFAALTLGSFRGLRTDMDSRDQPKLVGVRAVTGEPVAVEQMSDGTADQLYLALRLASLERHLEGREPLPFIVDDILIQFDNERSMATLRVFAELARSTQVIVFTHHQHLVDLAEEHLGAERFSLQRLATGAATIANA